MNAHDILARSVANYEKDWRAALNFTYMEREVKETGGEEKSTELSQVMIVDGTPYSRLIAKNGKPLCPEEAQKEEEKYRKVLKTRDSETAEQRARRLHKYENERLFIREVPDAFDATLMGEETIAGRPNYIVALTPKPGYVPKGKNARIFAAIEGKLWIDEQDLRWTKAQADVINSISIGWVLARIGPGAHITMTQVKVDDQHWMPKEINVSGAARIMLVMNRSLSEQVSFEDYKPARRTAAAVTAKNQ